MTTHPRFQEPEVFHDSLFRVGLSQVHGVTYTPRCIIFDSVAATRSLRVRGRLYDELGVAPAAAAWLGATTTFQQPSEDLSEFQRRRRRVEEGEEDEHSVYRSAVDESGVQGWADILDFELHPSTLQPCTLANERSYSVGAEHMRGRAARDAFEQSAHTFIEECDHFQGLQV
jgi:hypothetical protein